MRTIGRMLVPLQDVAAAIASEVKRTLRGRTTMAPSRAARGAENCSVCHAHCDGVPLFEQGTGDWNCLACAEWAFNAGLYGSTAHMTSMADLSHEEVMRLLTDDDNSPFERDYVPEWAESL